MKKGQISFEYIILFSVILIMFIALGTIIAAGVSKSRTFERDAQLLANQVKVQVITASLSEVDYYSEIKFPETIKKSSYRVDISAQDDMVLILDSGNAVMGRAFLPLIDEGPGVILAGRDTISINKTGDKLIVKKKQ